MDTVFPIVVSWGMKKAAWKTYGCFQKKTGTLNFRMVYDGKFPVKMDDLGVPLFSETSILPTQAMHFHKGIPQNY